MAYTLKTIWYERQRFLAGVLAVAFSAVLIALQCGLLLGLFSITSIPIDHAQADLWVGGPAVLSVDLGRPIPEGYLARVAAQPEVIDVESYLQGFAYWNKADGGIELCMIVAARLDDDSLGVLSRLAPHTRDRLSEPGAVAVDESELVRLGISGVGATAEIAGRRVRVVGLVKGFKSLAGPYIFCSIRTARPLLRMSSEHVTYVLGRCRQPGDAAALAERLRAYRTLSAFTAPEFSLRSRVHWL